MTQEAYTTHARDNRMYCKECGAELVPGPLSDIGAVYKCPNDRWVVYLGKATITHFVKCHEGHTGRSAASIETTLGIFPPSLVFNHKPMKILTHDDEGSYTEWS